MKSCLGMLLVLSVIVATVGTGVMIWYLSSNSEFSRKDTPATPPPAAAPAN